MARSPSRRSSLQTVDLSIDDGDVEVFDSEQLLHRPSRLRSFTVKLFVFVVFTAVALLVATELSIIYQLPWLDPRPFLIKAFRASVDFFRGLR
jgi:hypothetical protein